MGWIRSAQVPDSPFRQTTVTEMNVAVRPKRLTALHQVHRSRRCWTAFEVRHFQPPPAVGPSWMSAMSAPRGRRVIRGARQSADILLTLLRLVLMSASIGEPITQAGERDNGRRDLWARVGFSI